MYIDVHVVDVVYIDVHVVDVHVHDVVHLVEWLHVRLLELDVHRLISTRCTSSHSTWSTCPLSCTRSHYAHALRQHITVYGQSMTATHCNTLQHTAKHCNTSQSTGRVWRAAPGCQMSRNARARDRQRKVLTSLIISVPPASLRTTARR